MGYTIVYDRKFIRSNEGITVFALSGSSNCADFYYDKSGRRYKRRPRSWGVLGNNVGRSPEELIARAEEVKGYDFFMVNGKYITDDKYLRWWQNGIKNAVTIEDILRAARQKYMICRLVRWNKCRQYKAYERNISTTAEFDEWIREVRDHIGEYDVDFWILTNEPLAVVKENEKVIAKYDGLYVQEVCGRHILCGRYKENAKVFDNAEQALEACNPWPVKLYKANRK